MKISKLVLSTMSILAITMVASSANAYSSFPAWVDTAIQNKYGSAPVQATSCNSCHTTTAFGTEFRRAGNQLGYSFGSLTQTQAGNIVNSMSASVIQPLLPAPAPAPAPTPAPTPAPVCAKMAPTVTLTAAQTVIAGTTANYKVSVTNNDSAACAPNSFNLSFSAPSGSGINFAFGSSSGLVSAGTTATYSLAISSAVSSVSTANVTINFSVTATSVADMTMFGTANGMLTLTPSNTVDSTAPTTPTILKGVRKGRAIFLTYSASSDNVGVTGYAIYVDGSLAMKVSGLKARITGLTSGDHAITVQAFDGAGNYSDMSSALNITY